MIKYYHKFLQCIYFIIIIKIPNIQSCLILQMFFKAINNFVDFNKLDFTLLVFGTNLKITIKNAPSCFIT